MWSRSFASRRTLFTLVASLLLVGSVFTFVACEDDEESSDLNPRTEQVWQEQA